MISKTEEYALRAVVHLAEHCQEGPCRAQDIAEHTDIPANYLSKILHQLGRHGIVHSERGPRGGFQLSRDPAGISLSDVIEPFGSIADRGRCLLGRAECSDANPCGAHERWKAVRAKTIAFFAGTTVADVLDTGVPGDGSDPDTRTVREVM